MDQAFKELIGLGVAGAVLILITIGWLAPKWVVDYLLKKLEIQDQIIIKLTDALQRLADKAEARAAERKATDDRE